MIYTDFYIFTQCLSRSKMASYDYSDRAGHHGHYGASTSQGRRGGEETRYWKGDRLHADGVWRVADSEAREISAGFRARAEYLDREADGVSSLTSAGGAGCEGQGGPKSRSRTMTEKAKPAGASGGHQVLATNNGGRLAGARGRLGNRRVPRGPWFDSTALRPPVYPLHRSVSSAALCQRFVSAAAAAPWEGTCGPVDDPISAC